MSTQNGNQNGSPPRLVVFYSERSGQSRRVRASSRRCCSAAGTTIRSAFATSKPSAHPEIVERFRVEEVPTLVVVDDNRVSARVASPRGCREIEEALAPWLH